ncbi:MAG: NAD(+) diphosphatase [Caulobacterales bacterium]|nr:NAD(+) diphosphatase [Caulobacterales bacterium]
MTAPPPNAFAGNPLDRAGDHREDDGWITDRLARADGACLVMVDGEVLVEPGAEGEQIAWIGPEIARGVSDADRLFLGTWNDSPVFAVRLAPHRVEARGRLIDLRTAAAVLPGAEAAMAGTARSLFDWHSRHGFCANCGQTTQVVAGGWKRNCPDCEASHFPRVDPVAIMLPVYEGGAEPVCLLGRQAAWPEGRMSALAGFIEPGESIEEGCAREVAEEAGLRVVGSRYHSSQPWPFPHQLMIGLICTVDSDQAHANQAELESVTWLTRSEARIVLDGHHPTIKAPPPFAIAHQLIRAWAG